MQSLLGAAFTSLSEVCSDEFMARHWKVIEHASDGDRMFDLLISWLRLSNWFPSCFCRLVAGKR